MTDIRYVHSPEATQNGLSFKATDGGSPLWEGTAGRRTMGNGTLF